MTDDCTVIGLDLGGTNIKGLALAADGRVLAEETRPTFDRGGTAWRENVRAVCASLRTRSPSAGAAGLCAPGLPTRDGRTIAHMPGRLEGIEGFRWDEFLGVPTVVVNDAQAALRGEVWQGAARGEENVIMLTLGTGVGGAAMVDGHVLRGHLGRAGHLGHVSLDPLGPPDIVGTPGSLEDAIGECSLARRSGGKFGSTHELVAAYRAGDAGAARIWLRSLDALAAALVSFINVLDPAVIVLGGGMTEAGDALFVPLEERLRRYEWQPAGQRVRLVPAQLGTRAGAYGAACRALHPRTPPLS
jgi:glucokinase